MSCVPGWPLHHAVVYSRFPVFWTLLKEGAVANVEDLHGKVPSSAAVARLAIPHAILKYAK